MLGSKVFEFVISSYTPTLSSLIDSSLHVTPKKFQILAVAQPSASGQLSLPGTWKELIQIQERAKESDLAVSCLLESNARIEKVMQGMKESCWVHFACHGVQDIANPTDSGLLLAGKSRLKLSEIIKMSLPHAELAFLSACQTAKGAEKLPEEAVHLAAGMLFAGYQGVLATMWSVMDSDAPRVADGVYTYLFKGHSRPDYTQAAHALHYAVKQLREDSADKSFLSWVPFIHIGV